MREKKGCFSCRMASTRSALRHAAVMSHRRLASALGAEMGGQRESEEGEKSVC